MLVEFYPSSESCIQGCFHCPRSISQSSQVRVVSDVSDSQRELVTQVLSLPTRGTKKLNLSKSIGEYRFELFDDIERFGIGVIGFNAGILGQDTQEVMQSHIERLNQVIPKNSGERNIQICGNLQYNNGQFDNFPQDDFSKFVKDFFLFLRNKKCSVSDAKIGQVIVSLNSIPERYFTPAHILSLAQKISQAHIDGSDEYFFASSETELYPERGFFGIHSKIVHNDDFNADVNTRGIRAKGAKKQTFGEAFEIAKKGELVVTDFPDSVMVYHSSWNIHIPELFFTYDEFFEIVSEASRKNLSTQSRSLQQLVDLRLQERLK